MDVAMTSVADFHIVVRMRAPRSSTENWSLEGSCSVLAIVLAKCGEFPTALHRFVQLPSFIGGFVLTWNWFPARLS